MKRLLSLNWGINVLMVLVFVAVVAVDAIAGPPAGSKTKVASPWTCATIDTYNAQSVEEVLAWVDTWFIDMSIDGTSTRSWVQKYSAIVITDHASGRRAYLTGDMKLRLCELRSP